MRRFAFKHLTNKLRGRALPYILFALIFGIVGPILLLASHADTPTPDNEAESGSLSSGCVHKLDDTTASGGQGVKFGYCFDTSTPLNLDESGKTTPDTNYAIPAGAIFMATDGCDTAADPGCTAAGTGKINAPYRTLNKAIGSSKGAAITVVVRGGIYHDWYHSTYTSGSLSYEISNTIYKRITLQSYPGEHVWFDGTDDYTNGLGCKTTCNWKNNGTGQYEMTWSTPSFCRNHYYDRAFNQPLGSPLAGGTNSGPCSFWDSVLVDSGLQYHSGMTIQPNYNKVAGGSDKSKNYSENEEIYLTDQSAAGDPQMIFRTVSGGNQTPVPEVLCPSDITTLPASSFCYKEDLANHTGKLILGFNPGNGATRSIIEVTNKPGIFSIGTDTAGNADGSIIRGIGFRHYASDAYSGSVNRSVIFVSSKNTTFENDVFTENAGAGLSGTATASQAKLIHNVFAFNGKNGLMWNGAHNPGSTLHTDLQVLNNLFNGNNTNHHDDGCSESCAAANMKVANIWYMTFKNNIVENAVGVADGAWCDVDCYGVNYVNNLVHDNGGHGLTYEISDAGIIASNLVYHNGTTGILVKSADTKVYNNTIVDNSGPFKNGVPSGWEFNLYDDQRSPTSSTSDMGPDTTNISVFNNIMVDTTDGADISALANIQGVAPNDPLAKPPTHNTTPDQFFNKNSTFDHNTYWRYSNDPCWTASSPCTSTTAPKQDIIRWSTIDSTGKATKTLYNSMTNYRDGTAINCSSDSSNCCKPGDTSCCDTPSSCVVKKIELNSNYSHGHGADPFFTDAPHRNYTLKPTTSARGSATTIPPDVACAIGLIKLDGAGNCPSGAVGIDGQNLGALVWPGS